MFKMSWIFLYLWFYFHRQTSKMASDVTPRRAMNGQANGSLGKSVSGSTNMSLPGVDAEKLKARLYSYAPQQALVNTNALRFGRPTKAQLQRSAIPSVPKLEPLVSLNVLFNFHASLLSKHLKRKTSFYECLFILKSWNNFHYRGICILSYKIHFKCLLCIS